MRFHSRIYVGLLTVGVLAVAAEPVRSDSHKIDASPERGRKAAERGLEFLQKDAAKWRKEHGCATCHHGAMTVWALSEAKSQGYNVAAETLADMVKWSKERFL